MIWYVLVWCGLFLQIGSISSSNETCWPTANNLTCVLNDLLLGYNKQLRPNHTGDPIHVQVYMMIITLGMTTIHSSIQCYFFFFCLGPIVEFDMVRCRIEFESDEVLFNISSHLR